jgi:hypothetical protein
VFKFAKLTIVVIIISFYTAFALFMAVFSLWSLHQQLDNFQVARIDYSAISNREETAKYFNILNGKSVKSADDAVFSPLAVIIDNNPLARGQYGLERADLVIELPVEGGITRFLVFFQPQQMITKIGPVRSARPYFIDFAQGLRAILAHSGGSPVALARLQRAQNIINIDEIGPQGRYFWRDPNLPPPHNLFTSVDLLNRAALSSQPTRDIKYDKIAWQWGTANRDAEIGFKPDSAENKSSSITIDYSTYGYQVEYKYDEDKKNYQRYQAGKIHQTGEGDEIRLDNILIAFMIVRVLDNEGRLELSAIGQGKAVICKLGKCQEGIWKKPSAGQRIKFYADDKEAVLLPGKTWINIVPRGRRVKY